MSYSFNRKYEALIGTPTIEKEAFKSIPTTIKGDYTEFNPSEGIKFSDLNFRANISRSSKATSSNTDKTTLEFYNLPEEYRKYAEAEGALIIIKAGYVGDFELPLLYAGQIISVKTTTNGPDTITEIIAGDAYLSQKNARISKYYPPTTSKTNILKDLVLKLPGVSEGVFATALLDNSFYNSGYSASGRVVDVINKICRAESHEFIIENNRVNIRPKYIPADSTDFAKLRVRLFKVNSKQIKRPSGKMNNNATDLSNEKTTKAGYQFYLFLDGRVSVSSYIEVTDGDLKGIYKVTGVKHILDWRGQSWDTIVETEAA